MYSYLSFSTVRAARMTWSLVILDDGITNRLQAQIGKPTVAEYDFYYDYPDTDDGVYDTHGNSVVLSALAVSRAYDVIDLKVASAITGDYDSFAIERALDEILLDDDFSVAAINMSFGGAGYPYTFADEISALAARGVLGVVSSGNGGSHASLENPSYPAALPDVISVGSHDGAGRPSQFSQSGPAVDILADGENMPGPGSFGTSFAAPRVTATVTHVQAIVEGLTGTVLGVARMVDALQQGGAGPRSLVDPADGVTRYFLHDHAGSLDYAWHKYGGTPTKAVEYIASYRDLMGAFGANADAGRLHFERSGSIEEREISFDGLDYVASYGDLIRAFGVDGYRGASHFITSGYREGRSVSFDPLEYVASYGDLIGAYGINQDAGSAHFIRNGFSEGRTTSFDGLEYIASYGDLIGAYGVNQDAGSSHFIRNGFREGRATSFDGFQYIASHEDLIRALGANQDAGTSHYIRNGYREDRVQDTFDAEQYLAKYADLRAAFGDDEELATRHFITNGYREGRTDDAPLPSDLVVTLAEYEGLASSGLDFML